MSVDRLKAAIRDVPDFPREGVVFKDITPILSDPDLFDASIELFVDHLKTLKPDRLALIESRGFLFGACVARELKTGIIPIRKMGKLPYETLAESYDLEYGSSTLELHTDALRRGDRVVVLDDLLATGGTAAATRNLIEGLGGTVVEFDFLVELAFLNGRLRLQPADIFAPIRFD